MLDARHVFRKVTRKIYDFSPEQLADLTAIVWLHRGETKRFAVLLDDYREKCRAHHAALIAALPEACETTRLLETAIKKCWAVSAEFQAAATAVEVFRGRVGVPPADSGVPPESSARSCANERVSTSGGLRETREPAGGTPTLPRNTADECRTLLHAVRQLRRVAEPLIAAALDAGAGKEAKKELKIQRQRADEAWTRAASEAEAVVYFTRHLEWLRHRFPEGRYRDVPGLCKAVTRAEIAAADWSLTPGRYVGVAAAEVDEDFDFEQTMQDIHVELKELNAEAATLAVKVEENFEKLIG